MIRQLARSPVKLVYIALALVLLVFGVIGLVFPLMPGVLFLFAAIFCLGKASERVRVWSRSSAIYTGVERRVSQISMARGLDRMRLVLFMTLDAVVRSIDSLLSSILRRTSRE